MHTIYLAKGKEHSLKRFHPWVFSGAIKRIAAETFTPPAEGDVVKVVEQDGAFLALGHWANGSIAVRCFEFNEKDITNDYWFEKIKKAYTLREKLGFINNEKTNVYRLVNAEGDDAPGLIIDIYNDAAVIQTHSMGMHVIVNEIAEALKKVYGNSVKCIYDKSAETLPKTIQHGVRNKHLFGDMQNTEVLENGVKFNIDWVNGQKTGFFIDQRDNRDLLQRYVNGRSVLNTFCYSGGFSLYSLKAGAALVHSTDVSKKAIDLTEINVALNFYDKSRHESFAIETFDFLKGKQNLYDVIILDPPAFAKNLKARHNAVQGYKRLNLEALKAIKPNGILFTFSCSSVVDKELFNSTIMAAAIEAGRKVKILHQLHQPADHPINIFHPENEYLKGLVLFVE